MSALTRDEARAEHREMFDAYYITDESQCKTPPTPVAPSSNRVSSVTEATEANPTITANPPAKKTVRPQPLTPTRKSARIVAKLKGPEASVAPETSPTDKAGATKADAPASSDTSAPARNNNEIFACEVLITPTTRTPITSDMAMDPNTGRLHADNDQTSSEKELSSSTEEGSTRVTRSKGKAQAATTASEANRDDGKNAAQSVQTAVTGTRLATGTWKGQSSNEGHSSTKPPMAPNDITWYCAKSDCSSGQTWWPREGSGEVKGRKVGSHFFGRNKTSTNYINADVWHMYCRIDYQRERYNADKKGVKGVALFQLDHLEHQFLRLKMWRPQATFAVKLTAEMMDRSNIFQTQMRHHNNNVQQATIAYQLAKPRRISNKKTSNSTGAALPVPPTPEEAFPITLVDAFDRDWCGPNRDYDGVYRVLAEIRRMIDAGQITSMPPVEFMISKEQDGETVNDAGQNYLRWCAIVEKAELKGVKPFELDPDDESATEEGQKPEVGTEHPAATSVANAIEAMDLGDATGDQDAASETVEFKQAGEILFNALNASEPLFRPFGTNDVKMSETEVEVTEAEDSAADATNAQDSEAEFIEAEVGEAADGESEAGESEADESEDGESEAGESEAGEPNSSDPISEVTAATTEPTSPAPPPKFRFYATGHGNGRPMSNMYFAKPGNGAGNPSHKRKRSDEEERALDVAAAKKLLSLSTFAGR